MTKRLENKIEIIKYNKEENQRKIQELCQNIEDSNKKKFEELIKQNLNFNALGKKGLNPLHYGVYFNRQSIC